ncbi:homeobox domain protein, partial [Opisthorchis viverrini]
MESKNTKPVTPGSKVASSFSIRQLLCLSEPPFDCEHPTTLYCSKKQPISNDSLTRADDVLDEPPSDPVTEHKSSSCCPPELLNRFFSEVFGMDDACLENYNSKRNLLTPTTFVPNQSGDGLVKTSRQLSSHKTSSGLDATRCNSNILTGTLPESAANDLPPFFLHNNASTYASIPIFSRETSGKQYRRRKARTVFSDHQLLGLEHRFESQHYLSTPERIELANRLSLSET